MNLYESKTSWLGVGVVVASVVGVVLLMIVGGKWVESTFDKLSNTQNNPPATTTSTTPTAEDYIEQEVVVYSYGTSTVKETVRLPKAGYSPDELQAYLRSRWAFHASKEPVCTFVRDDRFLRGERIASFDFFKERVCLYSDAKNGWEPSN